MSLCMIVCWFRAKITYDTGDLCSALLNEYFNYKKMDGRSRIIHYIIIKNFKISIMNSYKNVVMRILVG